MPSGWDEMGLVAPLLEDWPRPTSMGMEMWIILFNQIDDGPVVYLNDGGQFSILDIGLGAPTAEPSYTISTADIDGDGLPELFNTGLGYAAMSHNQGDQSFGDWEFIHLQESYPKACYTTLALGDVDGDHDLDLFFRDWTRQRTPTAS